MRKKILRNKPIIGITCEVNKLKPYFSQFELSCDYRYVRAILRAGGIPVLIPINPYRKEVTKLLQHLDGLVIIGGADVHPNFYGEKSTEKVRSVYRGRIYFETWLYKMAQKKKIPVLAICYGMQLLNVIYGGTLYQDIRSNIKDSGNHCSKKYPQHVVRIQPGSLCHKIFKRSSFFVHSDHHQAVKTLGRSLKISAFSDDGIIEAIEGPSHTIAVQWHPERQAKDPVQKQLFRYFIRLARGLKP
ncbi:MAG: gamma-glutamyl-gamma-aminobutyrate hydrolase family protein [Candidatus Omnitrophota bacterium]